MKIFARGFALFLPDCRMIPFNNLEALEEQLRKGDVAAFIVEPVQGKEGLTFRHLDICVRLRPFAAESMEALFIDDEVQSGMGRTGRFPGYRT